MNVARRATPWLALMALTGCTLLPSRRAPTPEAERYGPPMQPALGRIVSHHPTTASAVIELHPAWNGPDDFTGHSLVVLDPATRTETARLVAARPRAGRYLSATITAGQPRPDDEVLIELEAPPPPAATTPPETGKPAL